MIIDPYGFNLVEDIGPAEKVIFLKKET